MDHVDQASRLRYEGEKKDFYKSELVKMKYSKTPDGRQLCDLNLQELEQLHENEKTRKEIRYEQ